MQVVNNYVPVLPAQAGVKGCFMAVLTSGDEFGLGDFAVYIGMVAIDPCDLARRAEAAEWVAFNGVKQSYTKALAFFPNLGLEEYRA